MAGPQCSHAAPGGQVKPAREQTRFWFQDGFGYRTRDSDLINNRQNGRRRGRGGGQQRPGGGGGQGQRDSGNRIDSRARGNAAQLLEKYKNMARDAQMSGDRVNTEYYLQFADHYFRVLADQRGRGDEQPQRRGRDDFDQFDDDDFGDEGEPIRAEEQSRVTDTDNGQRRERNPRDGYRENNRDAGRDNARDGGRDGNRDGGNRDNNRDGYREAGNRDGGRDAPRETGRDANRDNGNRDNGRDTPRDAGRDQPRNGASEDERRYQPVAAAAKDGALTPAPAAVAADDGEVAPRRRGRPRKVRDEAPEAVAVEPTGFDADRLPPSIGAPAGDSTAEDATGADDAPKPRRRRIRSIADAPAG